MILDAYDTAIEQFNQGDLQAAISACNEGLRESPTDTDLRIFLCQMLCFDENWKRVATLCDQILAQAGDDQKRKFFGLVVQQLMQGEADRARVWNDGERPKLFRENDEEDNVAIAGLFEAWQFGQEKQLDKAAERIDELVAKYGRLSGKCNGNSFATFSDVDPRTCIAFECFLPNGEYYWAPYRAIQTIKLDAPTRPLDQCWRQAQVRLKDAPADFYCYLPVRYYGTARDEDAQYQLGRMTRWDERNDSLERGVGRRIFRMDDGEEMCALQISEIEFD